VHSIDANGATPSTQKWHVRQYYTYILAFHSRRLYIGMTNDLVKRMYYHRLATDSFVARYRITRLVYFEIHPHPMNAIAREKQIKSWVRSKKIGLIEADNPEWLDLADGWLDTPLDDSQ
jgi:putative endonuclease